MPSLPFSGSAGRTKDVVKYKIFPSLNLCTLARKGSGGGWIKSGRRKGQRRRGRGRRMGRKGEGRGGRRERAKEERE